MITYPIILEDGLGNWLFDGGDEIWWSAPTLTVNVLDSIGITESADIDDIPPNMDISGAAGNTDFWVRGVKIYA